MVELTRKVEFLAYDPIQNRVTLHVRTKGTVDGQKIDYLNTQITASLPEAVSDALRLVCLNAINDIVVPELNAIKDFADKVSITAEIAEPVK